MQSSSLGAVVRRRLHVRASLQTRVGIVLAIAVAAFHVLPFAGKFGAYLAAGRFLETDFQSFYYAADATFNRGLSPYSLEIVRAYERTMGGVVYPFLYPPTALPWFFPLSLFGFTTALALFQLVSAVSLGIVVLLLFRDLVPRIEGRVWRLTFLGALFVFEGISATLNWAQINLIVLALVVIAWRRATVPQADRSVAFCLFAASALKTYPLIFLIVPLLRRRFTILLWFAVFAAVDLLLSVAILPRDVWHDWLVNIAPTGGYGAMPFGLFSAGTAGNQTLNGLFIRLLGEGDAARHAAMLAALACGGATTLAIFLARHLDDETYYGLSFGLVSVLTFLVAPLSWPHHFVFLLPALAWATVQVSRLRSARMGARGVLLVILVFCAYRWPIKDIDALGSPWLRSVPLLGPALLFGLLLALTAQQTGLRLAPRRLWPVVARAL